MKIRYGHPEFPGSTQPLRGLVPSCRHLLAQPLAARGQKTRHCLLQSQKAVVGTQGLVSHSETWPSPLGTKVKATDYGQPAWAQAIPSSLGGRAEYISTPGLVPQHLWCGHPLQVAKQGLV